MSNKKRTLDTNGEKLKLRKKLFKSVYGEPKWAEIKEDDENTNEDQDILSSCGFVKRRTKNVITEDKLPIQKLKNLNASRQNEGCVIRKVLFNKYHNLALVSGYANVASLYEIDGDSNKCLHSLSIEKFPIYCLEFINEGNEIILGSNQKYFVQYDIIKSTHSKIKLPSSELTTLKKFKISPDEKWIAAIGKCGNTFLIAAQSKELIHTFHQNYDVHSVAFTPDSKFLITNSSSDEMLIWNVNERRFFSRWNDDGCLHGSVIDISPSGQFVATGSCEGTVNLYEKTDVFRNADPKPIKVFENLDTRISSLKFNPTSEILCFSSSEKPNALKLANVASRKVFSNFQLRGGQNDLKYNCVRDFDFSPSSGYLAIAKNNPRVEMFRISNFDSYFKS